MKKLIETTVCEMRKTLAERIQMLYRQGFDIHTDALQKELDAVPVSLDAMLAFAEKLNPTTYRTDFHYVEPFALSEIQAERPQGARDTLPLYLSELEIRDKVYGGVYGRMAGCILGKPLEMGWNFDIIREYLDGVDAWPLQDYIPAYSPTQRYPLRRDCAPSMKGLIEYAQADDDINYLVLGLRVLEDYGRHFTAQNMLQLWRKSIPIDFTWSSEHTMYRISAIFEQIPAGDEWALLPTLFNCGEETIGAMIRGDAFGLVNPGLPKNAAALAWTDGSLTHKKTGLYAEQWVAATIAAAFSTSDPVEAIRAGIEQLPARARYTEVLREALDISLAEENWMDAYTYINEKWGHLGHAGTMNESAAIINALVHSVGEDHLVDYEKAICITVMHGWDTDCSGATAGCIAGVLAGHHAIPKKWLAPLNNTFYTAVADESDNQISAFAERMYQMSRIMRG